MKKLTNKQHAVLSACLSAAVAGFWFLRAISLARDVKQELDYWREIELLEAVNK